MIRVCVTPSWCWKSLQVWFRWNTATRCCWCPHSKEHYCTALRPRRSSSWEPSHARGTLPATSLVHHQPPSFIVASCVEFDWPFLVGWSSGRFGACFLPALCKQSDLEVFAARPGLRLWRSNIRGQVEDTHLFKSLFKAQVDWEYWQMLWTVTDKQKNSY